MGSDSIYFVDIGSTCGTGGDFRVYEGNTISGDVIGYIHISCSDELYIGLAFDDQEENGFGPFTLVGACFTPSKRNVQTPKCLGQCDGIIKEGACTDGTTAAVSVAASASTTDVVAPWAPNNKKKKNKKKNRGN